MLFQFPAFASDISIDPGRWRRLADEAGLAPEHDVATSAPFVLLAGLGRDVAAVRPSPCIP
jgi:hypothetical protein